MSIVSPDKQRDGNATDWWLQQQSNGQAFSIRRTVSVSVLQDTVKIQELSYRKQIARKLRTQYVEGINDNPVTLKSRLTVTQRH